MAGFVSLAYAQSQGSANQKPSSGPNAEIHRDALDALDIAIPFFTRAGNTLRLTGGFSARDGSFAALEDSFHNLFHLAETLHVRAEIGVRARSIEFGLRKTLPGPRPIQYGFTVYGQRFRYNQEREASITAFQWNNSLFDSVFKPFNAGDPVHYVLSGYGVKMFAEHAFQRELSKVSLAYSFDVSAIRPLTDGTREFFTELNFRGRDAPDRLTGIRTSKVNVSYAYNSIVDPDQPTRGASLRFSTTIAGPGGTVRMIEPDIEAKYFHSGLVKRHVVAIHLHGRLLSGYGGRSAPPYERFYMGGENEVRGFHSARIGPFGYVPGVRLFNVLNPDGSNRTLRGENGLQQNVMQEVPLYRRFSIGGDTNVVTNIEYRIPIRGPVSLAFFQDAGLNRITFARQLQLNDHAIKAAFNEAGITDRVLREPGLQNVRISVGAQIQVMVPKINVPVRIYWAYNALIFEGMLLYPPLVADRSMFPNFTTYTSVVNTLYPPGLIPYQESRSMFRIAIGRSF